MSPNLLSTNDSSQESFQGGQEIYALNTVNFLKETSILFAVS